jgi:AraC family transcriptional regulator
MFDARKFNYYIASASDKPVPEGMVEFMVPAATWAIFPCKRTEIAEVEIRIVSEWQPTSGYELLNRGYDTGEMKSQAPDLEVHGMVDTSEVWVAVRNK